MVCMVFNQRVDLCNECIQSFFMYIVYYMGFVDIVVMIQNLILVLELVINVINVVCGMFMVIEDLYIVGLLVCG